MKNKHLYNSYFNSEENEATYAESVQYHSVGPAAHDTLQPSLHMYSCIGDYRENSDYSTAAAGVVGMDTECYTYENPNPDAKVSNHLCFFNIKFLSQLRIIVIIIILL